MEMVHHRINERSSSAREGCRQHEAKLQCSPKARATQHHHARATKVKAACLDSGDVRLGLSRRSPSERANCCATCRQRMDSTPTSARSDARAVTGARGAAGGFLVPRVSFKVGFSRGESQNFLSFSFWKENDRIKSGLRPSSETDRQEVRGAHAPGVVGGCASEGWERRG